MRTYRIEFRKPVLTVLLVAPLSLCRADLVVSHDSGLGITDDPPVSAWADQEATGGSQDFSSSFSQRPTLGSGVTPLGQDAIGFDGVNDNMKFGATTAFDTDPSLTFMMLLRPGSLSGNQAYLNSAVSGASGADNGWGLYLIGGNFEANVREGAGGASSTLSATGFQDEWIILSGVYNGSTIQLFLTEEDGTLQTGSAVSVDMVDGLHLGTQIGARGLASFSSPATADIAALRIWDEALGTSARAAAEQSLYATYIAAIPEPGAGTLLLIGAVVAAWSRRPHHSLPCLSGNAHGKVSVR